MRYEVELVDLQEQHTAVVCGRVPHEGIAPFLGSAFGEVMAVVQRQDRELSGPPFARYRATDDDGWEVEAGFPVKDAVAAEGRVEPGRLPGGRTARTVHVGDYAGLGEAYQATEGWLTDNGYVAAGAPWECYLDAPEVPHPRTEVFFPCHEARPLART